MSWVCEALILDAPDCTSRRVSIHAGFPHGGFLARCHVAADRADLHHMTRVRGTFSVTGPSWAIVVSILASALADAASNWTMQVHVVWVLLALALLAPMVAIDVNVSAQWCAETATRRALAMHKCRRSSAFATLGPSAARVIPVVADEAMARLARVWADGLDMFGIAAFALSFLGPCGAGEVPVVTESDCESGTG